MNLEANYAGGACVSVGIPRELRRDDPPYTSQI